MAERTASGRAGERNDHLPPAVEGFAGCAAELAQLRREIRRDGLRPPDGAGGAAQRPRVLVVAGQPGSGRTALAVRLARELADDRPDGLLYVRLTGPDGEGVAAERAAADLLARLGVPLPLGAGETLSWEEDPDREGDGTACALLRATLATRRAVLVADDAVGAAQLEALLPEGPGCLVIATTRGPLTGLRDARPVILGGLDRPAARELLARYADDTRMVVDPRSADRLAELCGSLPAALRLLGRWLAARPQAPVTEAVRRLNRIAAAEAEDEGTHPAGTGPDDGGAPRPRPAAEAPDAHWVADAGILEPADGAERDQVEFDRGDFRAPVPDTGPGDPRDAAQDAAEPDGDGERDPAGPGSGERAPAAGAPERSPASACAGQVSGTGAPWVSAPLGGPRSSGAAPAAAPDAHTHPAGGGRGPGGAPDDGAPAADPHGGPAAPPRATPDGPAARGPHPAPDDGTEGSGTAAAGAEDIGRERTAPPVPEPSRPAHGSAAAEPDRAGSAPRGTGDADPVPPAPDIPPSGAPHDSPADGAGTAGPGRCGAPRPAGTAPPAVGGTAAGAPSGVPARRAGGGPAADRHGCPDADAAEHGDADAPRPAAGRVPPPAPAVPSGDPLRRCFAVVHRDLTPSLARLLRLLVLVPEGVVTAHFASALSGYPVKSAASGLLALADAGLLERRDAAPVAPVAARYRMPLWLRPFADEQLARLERPGEVELALARMLERTARLLTACQAVLLPPPDGVPRPQIAPDVRFHSRAQARSWLLGELPVLMAAADRAVASGTLDTLGQRLTSALLRLLDADAAQAARAERRSGRERADRTGGRADGAPPREDAPGPDPEAAPGTDGAGGPEQRQRATGGPDRPDGPEEAAPAPPRALHRAERYRLHGHMFELARRRGDFAQYAAALVNIGGLDASAGRHPLALHRYRTALTAVRDAADSDPDAEGHILELLARTHIDLGDLPRAADWYRRALALRRARGELADQARLLGRLAAVATRLGDLDGALRDLRARTRLHRRLGDPVRLARDRLDLAALHRRAGRGQEALDAVREAISAARGLGDLRLERTGLLRAAELLTEAGDDAGARLHRERAAELAGALGGGAPGRPAGPVNTEGEPAKRK